MSYVEKKELSWENKLVESSLYRNLAISSKVEYFVTYDPVTIPFLSKELLGINAFAHVSKDTCARQLIPTLFITKKIFRTISIYIKA